MLDSKVVLITGANGGLGTAVTLAFLNANARVAGVSGSISRAEFDHPSVESMFEPIAKRIGSRKDAEEIVSVTQAKWGRLDALVHLVGGFAGGTAIPDTDAATFDKMFEVNTRAFLYMAQAVLPVM